MAKKIDESRLRMWRGAGFTQRDCAIILGVSQQRISTALKRMRAREFRRLNITESWPELKL